MQSQSVFNSASTQSSILSVFEIGKLKKNPTFDKEIGKAVHLVFPLAVASLTFLAYRFLKRGKLLRGIGQGICLIPCWASNSAPRAFRTCFRTEGPCKPSLDSHGARLHKRQVLFEV
jgi:hypothetical protein